MKERKSFLIYNDWANFLKPMTKEQVGELFIAVFDYNKDGVVPEFEDVLLSGVFAFMQSRFDDDNKKYEKICKRNAEIAKKRWDKEKKADNTEVSREYGAAESERENGVDAIPVPRMYKI